MLSAPGGYIRRVELTRAEPGSLRFEVEGTDCPLARVVSGQFVDQAAFDVHQARARDGEWDEETTANRPNYVIDVSADQE